jgi:hypothetical protein
LGLDSSDITCAAASTPMAVPVAQVQLLCQWQNVETPIAGKEGGMRTQTTNTSGEWSREKIRVFYERDWICRGLGLKSEM